MTLLWFKLDPKDFLLAPFRKLQSHSAGQFKVRKRFEPNAYVISPPDYGISSTIYVTDLVANMGSSSILVDPFSDPHISHTCPYLGFRTLTSILGTERTYWCDSRWTDFVHLRQAGFTTFSSWREQLDADYTWITREVLKLMKHGRSMDTGTSTRQNPKKNCTSTL